MSTYVCSDIHGLYDEFIKMLKLINFSDSDKLYICGDVIDRGPNPIKLIQYIMKVPNITLLRGNHEDMMMDALKDNYYLNSWLVNGGETTFNEFMALLGEDRIEIIGYLHNTPIYKKLEINGKDFILSHAGLEVEDCEVEGIVKIANHQTLDFMLWSRSEFYNQNFTGLEEILVVGHTPVDYHGIKDDTMYKHPSGKVIDIDCGAVFYGKLCCLRLDDMEEFYVERKKDGDN